MLPHPQWQILTPVEIPRWFQEIVKGYTRNSDGLMAAQLLWQRGITDPLQLPGFLDPDAYQPSSPFAFGQEMKWAVQRLQQALSSGEKLTIWGDFDADGITATSVLWEGLGEFFPQYLQLDYYIPNRFSESHGLNCSGIDRLARQGTRLIITCDTGSTNLTEIEYANQLGIDIIISDHHTLPQDRPPVIAIINPRYFDSSHPLFHLSGVAVAYKLVEALYQTLPDLPKNPLLNLLDLVAIGLIADLVQLVGDCRYLAQRGIQKLQQQLKNPTRPGIARLLELCQRSGDRPTDISFGLGPRINAVSRIQGDATFCVELLTSKDSQRCQKLALETELANTRRKALQKEITAQVQKKLSQLDLSTTHVIVLEDPQWQSGVLGLVAGQIATEYNRPTILLTPGDEENADNAASLAKIARGSARSVNHIDLYQLVASQSHLLHRFGGHPLAAGLSLPVENISLFRDGINQQLRQQHGDLALRGPVIEADLVVSVAELGKALFWELKLLEPYGMGNPIPKLLIQDCWFENAWHNNPKDLRGKKIQYIKTTFQLRDNSVNEGFPGVWWGHYKDELPQNTSSDALVELDYNLYEKRYEVRLLAVRPHTPDHYLNSRLPNTDILIDWRNQPAIDSSQPVRILQKCPTSWDEIQQEYRRAIALSSKLALAYPPPQPLSPEQTWEKLVGMAKYLSRRGQTTTLRQMQEQLNLSRYSLNIGLQALSESGFHCHSHQGTLEISHSCESFPESDAAIYQFFSAVEEEQFIHQYFSRIPLSVLQNLLEQTPINFDIF
ncbi:single-stranded-DNA-specific exonuclease RecJ [Gloeothece verrucosa]|uniref:Single-stranded-DNA-specific exonuclease RecJ n=1 Tax=Gloeothece verrucosa (strain PCC 7822) TaxID=497965 RepID=E0UAZ7_GLOV7|nr:single-stranded-DNA-specific exonuclease RecJ [Gloeothece verrucosa]ADN15119.1 single-stranded-DNA-specific exonuclease RecJ [Gloeothece verrucosa PCC 7822]